MAVQIYEPYVESFVNKSTITVSHNFGRAVNVFVCDTDGKEIFCDVQNNISEPTNKLDIAFFAKGIPVSLSGKVVVS